MNESKKSNIDESKTSTKLDFFKEKINNTYAVIIVLLIGLLIFMFYPTVLVYFFLALIIPMSLGIVTEMFFQTDYYDSLNYQLSRLEKTMIISSIVSFSALGMGYFAGPIHDWLEGLLDV
jgi:hypothetical protein